MSGLGLLATAFGSYASTLGGLYKEQVEKERAAQEKLAAEERQREWEREKTAEERAFAIDMLQRKFDYEVKLKSMENEWEARNADIAHQRALERIGYAFKLKLEEDERAAQEKLAAEERQREWEREKTAEERAFAIDMLQRKFDYEVKLKSMENEWEARNADIAHQRALERMDYASKLKLEEDERRKQLERRDLLARLAVGGGLGSGKGVSDMDPREFASVVKALSDRVRYIGEMASNANEEERPGWLAMYNAALQDLDYFIKNRELPKGSSFGEGSFFVDPEVIVNSLANE